MPEREKATRQSILDDFMIATGRAQHPAELFAAIPELLRTST